MPKKITIFEDGTKKITELSAFSVDKNDIVEYAFADDNGYYYLDEEQMQSADQYLLIFKIGFLARKRLLNDFLLLSVRNEALKEIKNATNDISIQKYLTKQIESLFNNLSLSFEDIVRELDAYTIDVVMEMFEDVNNEADENPEYIDFELIGNYRNYVGKRSNEKEYRLYTEGITDDDTYSQDDFDDYQTDISLLNEMQNEEINYQESEHKKEHRFLKGVGKFAKKASYWFLGNISNMSDEQIKDMQNADNLYDVFDIMKSHAENYKDDINTYRARVIAWKNFGMDYNEFRMKSYEEKKKYLISHGIDTNKKRDALNKEIENMIEEIINTGEY